VRIYDFLKCTQSFPDVAYLIFFFIIACANFLITRQPKQFYAVDKCKTIGVN
jgi:hypothetical protein